MLSAASSSEPVHSDYMSNITLPQHTDTLLTLQALSTFRYVHGWRRRLGRKLHRQLVAGFHPAYFAAVMGCGMSANLLYNFPFPARWLQVCGCIVAVVALGIFVVLNGLFLAALQHDRSLFARIHCDRTCAPFMGCHVMAFTTLVTFLHAVAGPAWTTAVYVLWWIATVASFYTAFVTFFLSTIGKSKRAEKRMDTSNLTMAYLLPVVTLTVSASCGCVIAPDLASLNLVIVTSLVCFVMWAIAVVLGFIIVTVNFWRLFIHRVPVTGQVFTMFLPIGYLGQGAYAIMLFGRNCSQLLLEHSARDVAASPYTSFLHETATKHSVDLSTFNLVLATSVTVVCTLAALTLMAFGYFFTFLAFASVLSKIAPFARHPSEIHIYQTDSTNWVKRRLVGLPRFQRAFWSMTFPIGTIALANVEMYHLFEGLKTFRYLSVIYACITIVVTLGCLVGVVYRGVNMVLSSRMEEAPEKKAPKEIV